MSHQFRKNRIAVRLTWVALLCLLGTTIEAAHAQVPPALMFDNSTLREVVGGISNAQGVSSEIIGQQETLVSGQISIEDRPTAQVYHQLDNLAGTLSVVQGTHVVVYGRGAETQLGNTPITYIYRFQHVPVTTAFSTSAVAKTELKGELTDASIVEPLNGIFLRGSLKAIHQAVRILRLIDQPQHNVLIELLIIEYARGSEFEWQINLTDGTLLKNYRNGKAASPDPFPDFPFDENGTMAIPAVATAPNPRRSGFDLRSDAVLSPTGAFDLQHTQVGGRLSTDFKANVTSLVAGEQARIVTNPRIMTLSGEEGTFNLTQTINFLALQATGIATSSTKNKVEAISNLTVTPAVNSAEQISLTVDARLSNFVRGFEGVLRRIPSASDRAGTATNAIVDTRENTIKTTAWLADGETLILGGLIKEERLDSESGFPVLRDLRGIGRLFRREKVEKQFIETVIYITPHLSNSRNRDQYYQETEDKMRQMRQQGEELLYQQQTDDLIRLEIEERARRDRRRRLTEP